MTKEELWEAALGEIELNLSKPSFTTWFKNTFISLWNEKEEEIIIGVPSNFALSWLEEKYHKIILQALQDIAEGKVKKISYKVETKTSYFVQTKTVLKVEREGREINEFGLSPRYTFTSFVVGKSNELAHAASQAAAYFPGKKYNPLFIYGGVGLGKTHLLQAIGHEVIKKFSKKKKILYLNAEKFTNEYVQAIREGNVKDFKNKYRNSDVLLIDDIQFIAGKEGTQEEFFHTFNALHQRDSQIVLTSDRPPKAIPALEERLTSRFGWGMICDVTYPDLETRVAIVEAKAKEKNFNLDKKIVQYLATTIQKNIRELEGALNKIIAYSELHNVPPTLEIARSILTTLISQPRKGIITARELIKTIADFYELKIEEVFSESRKRELVLPRQITMYLLRTELDCSFPMIGHEMGNRDHTTAMHAYKKISGEMENEGRIKQEIEAIKQRIYNL